MGFFKKLSERVTKPKSSVSLKLDKYTFTWGDRLEGKLLVSSDEEVDVTEVRAELRCEEKKKETVRNPASISHSGIQTGGYETRWTTRKLFSENPQGSGPIHLSPGYRGEFPFSTNVAGGEPSYSSGERSVTWTIKGVIAINGRPDVTSSTAGITVSPAPTTVTTEKIVEREVVMIPCQYCKSLFPQTMTTCPNCGAQRRV